MASQDVTTKDLPVAGTSSQSAAPAPRHSTSSVNLSVAEENYSQQVRRSQDSGTPRGILKKRREESSSNIDNLLGNESIAGGVERHWSRDMGKNTTISRSSSGREAAGARENDTESSADEATNIMRRTSSSALNYSTTSQPTSQPQPQSTVKPRSAKKKPSTQSIRRRGRIASATEGDEEDEANEHQGWWARFLSEYGSIELENKGSVARDHLALERTFLAWLRTSLAFASIGIAITQLFRLNVASQSPDATHKDRYATLRSMGKPLGATFLGISILMLFIGFNRYFESQHWIIRGKFPASRGSIIVVGLVTFALMITSLVVVIVVEPSAREK